MSIAKDDASIWQSIGSFEEYNRSDKEMMSRAAELEPFEGIESRCI